LAAEAGAAHGEIRAVGQLMRAGTVARGGSAAASEAQRHQQRSGIREAQESPGQVRCRRGGGAGFDTSRLTRHAGVQRCQNARGGMSHFAKCDHRTIAIVASVGRA
jgi:hypothetical protein